MDHIQVMDFDDVGEFFYFVKANSKENSFPVFYKQGTRSTELYCIIGNIYCKAEFVVQYNGRDDKAVKEEMDNIIKSHVGDLEIFKGKTVPEIFNKK